MRAATRAAVVASDSLTNLRTLLYKGASCARSFFYLFKEETGEPGEIRPAWGVATNATPAGVPPSGGVKGIVHTPVSRSNNDKRRTARELLRRPLRLGPIARARTRVTLKRFPGFAICGFALLACMTDSVTGTFPAGCHSGLHALGL